MALLVVRGNTSEVSWSRGHWVVRRDGKQIQRLRPRGIDAIHLLGKVELTAAGRAAAVARGVPVVLFTAHQRYQGRIEGPRAPTGALQVAQVRHLADPANALELARAIVQGKLDNSRRMLLVIQRTRRDERIAAAAAQLRALRDRVAHADSVASLRGHEGDGARIYFGVFPALITNAAFPWRGRSRRPPRDPINAALSFGYTILSSEVDSAVLGVGLLRGVGALHETGPSRAPLVYDLVEELRAPIVDRTVLRLVNRQQLAPEDFVDPAWMEPSFPAPLPGQDAEQAASSSGAIHLGKDARQLLLRELRGVFRGDLLDAEDGAHVRTRWLLDRQARRVARVCQSKDGTYQPFSWGAR